MLRRIAVALFWIALIAAVVIGGKPKGSPGYRCEMCPTHVEARP